MMTVNSIINISNLSKVYEDGFQALNAINLDINNGEIFALLGPNGAGKTTLINMICGIVNIQHGEVKVAGLDIIKDFRETRAMIGLVPQELTSETFETVWSTVSFSRGLFGKQEDAAYIEKVLKSLSLWDKKDNTILTLSGGMKRRVLIAKALAHEPKIIFLDEPTAGVDVELRQDMWGVVKQLKDEGVTIILTTHYIEEAELLCENIAIIDEGKILKKGTPKDLTKELGTAGISINVLNIKENIKSVLLDYKYNIEDNRIHFSVKDPDIIMPEIIQVLTKAGMNIQKIESTRSSLEDVFLNLTGKGINE